MPSRKKQLQLFMIKEDERKISYHLRDKYKDIIFLDNNIWDSKVKMVGCISKCKSNYCYIWNRDILKELPTIYRKDGNIEGPTSGVVIQFERCIKNDDGYLLSGSISIGYDTKNVKFHNFINEVWKDFKRMTKLGVYFTNQTGYIDRSKVFKEYAVGKEARNAIIYHKIEGFKHRSTFNYYYPID